ncbi:MAG: erythromycin esterase family protein, partial [Flavobacteriales bacterium]|nr:erythromycin esterase family protein [Flavobacteriales bacterium]
PHPTGMKELLGWIKDWNNSHPEDLVHLYGYQNVHPEKLADNLRIYLMVNDDVTEGIVKKPLREFGKSYVLSGQAEWHQRALMEREMKKVRTVIEDRLPKWLNEAENAQQRQEAKWAVQQAISIHEASMFILNNTPQTADSLAAAMIRRVRNLHPGKKMVLWSNDLDISKGLSTQPGDNFIPQSTIGNLLNEAWGDKYRSISFVAFEGTHRATPLPRSTKHSFPITTPPQGTIEEALHEVALQINEATFILDLNKAARNKGPVKFLNRALPARQIRFVPQDFSFRSSVNWTAQFDKVVFIDRVEAAK